LPDDRDGDLLMARRRVLKARDVERLEATSLAIGGGLTTMATFCCPTQSGICRAIATGLSC
jgi:hypothetical protein